MSRFLAIYFRLPKLEQDFSICSQNLFSQLVSNLGVNWKIRKLHLRISHVFPGGMIWQPQGGRNGYIQAAS